MSSCAYKKCTLHFIKAYRLKVDKDSLRRIVGECFSNDAVEVVSRAIRVFLRARAPPIPIAHVARARVENTYGSRD